ncbi:MAG: glycerophosphodiester phosphodiesterase family protein [Sphingosinicella sp.]
MRSRRDRLADLIARPFAHRGLHRPGVQENSRAAFQAAVDAGYGIELDVQATSEGAPVVIHDAGLDRLSEAKGRVSDHGWETLANIRLKDSDETIPLLDEVLALIGGRVPLLIEIKAGTLNRPLADWVNFDLHDYPGPVAVMSFNPRIVRRIDSAYLCGLVVSEGGKKGLRGYVERFFAFLWSRPDFLAYDVRDLPSRFASRQRGRDVPIITWTCRTESDRERAVQHADQVIFEGSPA